MHCRHMQLPLQHACADDARKIRMWVKLIVHFFVIAQSQCSQLNYTLTYMSQEW